MSPASAALAPGPNTYLLLRLLLSRMKRGTKKEKKGFRLLHVDCDCCSGIYRHSSQSAEQLFVVEAGCEASWAARASWAACVA